MLTQKLAERNHVPSRGIWVTRLEPAIGQGRNFPIAEPLDSVGWLYECLGRQILTPQENEAVRLV